MRWLSSHCDNLFERYFGRLVLAQLAPETAAELVRRVIESLSFWRRRLDAAAAGPDYGCARDRLRLFIAALSRLTIRQSGAEAAATFALACDLAKDRHMGHHWLAEILGDLLKFSVQAVPPSDRAALLLPALEFPLAAEKNADPHFWPDSVLLVFWGLHFDRPAGEARWTARIQQLIEASGAGQPSRQEAVQRMAFLAKQDSLTPAERKSFGEALWSEVGPGDNAVPERTGLLITMFAKLPAPTTIDAPARVRVRLFGEPIATWLLPSEPYHSQIDADKLNHIQSFLLAAKDNLLPTPEQAARIFDGMMAWRPSPSADNDPLMASAVRSFEDTVRRIIGDAISLAIVPAMSAADVTDERANAVLRSIEEAGIRRARGCLPYFLNNSSNVPDEIVRSLRRGVIGSTFDDVAGATGAIEKWIELLRKGNAPPLPEQLVEQVVSAVETRREPGLNALLQCVRRLTEEKLLGIPHTARLVEGLDDLLVGAVYANIDPDSREAVSISLVRAECVKLARALDRIGAGGAVAAAWMAAAEADPLPEVRFALTA